MTKIKVIYGVLLCLVFFMGFNIYNRVMAPFDAMNRTVEKVEDVIESEEVKVMVEKTTEAAVTVKEKTVEAADTVKEKVKEIDTEKLLDKLNLKK